MVLLQGTHTIGILSYSGDFQVRPTKVKFYYRYIPEGDDVGVIELKIEKKIKIKMLFYMRLQMLLVRLNINYMKYQLIIW